MVNSLVIESLDNCLSWLALEAKRIPEFLLFLKQVSDPL